jgi:hypothetical protein
MRNKTLPIVWYSKERYVSETGLRKWETHTQLGLLERANLSHIIDVRFL